MYACIHYGLAAKGISGLEIDAALSEDRMPRHLICLIDGTMVSAAHTERTESYSNIFELACLLQREMNNSAGEPQIVFYRSGISSQPDSRSLVNAATGGRYYPK